MFTVYHSNQLDVLTTLMSTLIARDPLNNPFQHEVIIVHSFGMAQWLQIQLAEKLGITANISFPLPATFIWEMCITVLPNIPKESDFSKEAMTWKIMWLLQELLSFPAFAPLQLYLTDDRDKRKIYQLAGRIADIFDQYLVFRPEWLESWQQGQYTSNLDNSQQWQPLLWARLVEYTYELEQSACHRANLYNRFISALNNAKHCPVSLPSRVFICGISSLPPVYLNVFQSLSRHIDIHLMVMNPCRYYWGDITNTFLSRVPNCKLSPECQIQQKKPLREQKPVEQLFNSKLEQPLYNPILASLGKLGGDYLYLLSQLEGIQEIEAFVDIPANNMLHAMQHNILELENHAIIGSTPETCENSLAKSQLNPEDHSICFHVCHSPKRELEVLHDQLLKMLEEDLELQPRDIIVMISDMDRYTPYIQAVFGKNLADCKIPFVIANRKTPLQHPMLKAFISLLNLLQSRFIAEDVIAFLEVPMLTARFAVNEEELYILRHWIYESGIRWGLDNDNVRDLDLPVTGQHTWHFGITRMLLGYAMDSKDGDWNGILPYDASSGLDAELAGKLADIMNNFSYWRQFLSKMRPLEEWLPLCQHLINAFFVQDKENQVALTLIKQQWQQIINFGLTARYTTKISFSVLRDDLVEHLDQTRISQHFMACKINFCTLMPMRSIPFKIICLLGMNDGVYPQIQPTLRLNLMAQQPQCGDRNRRDDDLYLFLEAILAAQQKLYISFIGRAIQDNRERYPSVLVTELLEYLAHSYCLPGDEYLDTDSSAKRMTEYLLNWHARMPFSAENFIPGTHQQSYAAEWLPAASRFSTAYKHFRQPLLPVNQQKISLDELRRFYNHPIRAFFQVRLGIRFNLEAKRLPNEEPFSLDNRGSYNVNKQLLNTLIEDRNLSYLFQKIRANGELPFGAFGEIYWKKQQEEMYLLAAKVRAEYNTYNSIEIDINIDGIHIIGWLHQVQDNGLLRWRSSRLSAVDGLLLWLEHLLYCCAGGTGISRMYGRQNSTWRFEALTLEDAKKYLSELIAGYQRGLCQPLLLLKKSGWAWLKQCYQPETREIDWKEETQKRAKEKLLQAWKGNIRIPGEREDHYIQRVFRPIDLDNNDLEKIFVEAERYFMPLAKFHIN